MKTTLFILSCFLLLSSTDTSSGQVYSSSVQTKDLTFPLPNLTTIPQLHTDMSFDCFIGYVAMDSLIRSNVDIYQVLNAPSQLSIRDLRFVARLLYGMDEYSHAHLNAHFAATRDTGRSMYDNRPFMANFYTPVIKAIGLDRWKEFDPQIRALLVTHYIYRVRVVNVAQGIDSSYGSNPLDMRPRTAVSCEVVEKVKGMKVPSNCPIYYPAGHGKNENDKPLGHASPCISFIYNSRFLKTVPQIGEEYYVFLVEHAYSEKEDFLLLIDPSAGSAGGEAPPVFGGWSGMFKVKNGNVEDPKKFWSTGSLTVEQFRTLLQSKIAEIKSWTPGS